MKEIQVFLPKVYRDLVTDPLTEEDLVLSYWPRTVGRVIAEQTRPLGVFGTELSVEVTDPVWLSELQGLSWRITKQLNKAIGKVVLKNVRFRLGRLKSKTPARATSAKPAATDEADGIQDPGLRRIFHLHRKAAG